MKLNTLRYRIACKTGAVVSVMAILGVAMACPAAHAVTLNNATIHRQAGFVAQAIPSTGAAVAAPLSAHAPGGRAVAFRQAIIMPAGSQRVAGSTHGVSYSITRTKASQQTSPCTLTVYDPYWFGSSPNNYVQASAYLFCNAGRLTQISVTAVLYSGVSPYSLLGYATTTADDTNGVFGVYNYQVYQYGYYITGGVGYAGSPLDQNIPEQTSPDTWISWPT
jgi:hypothetical protein